MVRCPECEQWVSVDVVGDVAMLSWHNSAAGDLHYSFCSASGQSVTRNALHAFGEVIATIARAALIRDAACGRDIVAKRNVRADDMTETPTHRAEAVRSPDGCRVSAWKYTDHPTDGWSITTTASLIVAGRSEDTAAEVVDTLLRLVAEWEATP